MKKRWVWMVAAAIVLVILAWLWLSRQPEATVDAAHPVVQTLRAFIEEQAVTELPHDYLISMPIAGWLQPIELREGDPVSAGQIVARLETDDLLDHVRQAEQRIAILQTQIAETRDHRLEQHMLVEAQAAVKAIDETVQAAEAQLEGSLASMEFAQSEVARISDLAEANVIAERELSEARKELRISSAQYRGDVLQLAALKTLAAVSYIGPKYIIDTIDRKSFTLETHQRELEQAQAQLEIEKRNLQRAEIHSPIDGVVLARHETRRQYLAAGTPLLTVGRLEDLEVIAEILTERAPRIAPGHAVEIFGDAVAGGSIPGHVARVYPAGFTKISSLGVEQQRVNVAIEPDLRPARLGVGFRVYVRIYYEQADGALTIPRTSLFRGPRGAWQVLVVEDGAIAQRPVQAGLMNDELAQILEGLSTSDTVVIHPAPELQPGTRVQARGI